MASVTRPQAEVEDLTFTVPVNSNQVTLNLNDLQAMLSLAQHKRRSQNSGDKYVDALRRYGVKLDWRVQNAPEFLATAKMELLPTTTVATDYANSGKLRTRYNGSIDLKFDGKAFAEHGTVFIMVGVRPVFLNARLGAPLDDAMRVLPDFYIGNDIEGAEKHPLGKLVTNSPEPFQLERYSAYRRGVFFGNYSQIDERAAKSIAPASLKDYIYPPGVQFVSMESVCRSNTFGKIPVKPRLL